MWCAFKIIYFLFYCQTGSKSKDLNFVGIFFLFVINSIENPIKKLDKIDELC